MTVSTSGLPAEQHLAVIGEWKSELAEPAESKAAHEGRRVKLLAAVRGLGVLDDYELAALGGLQHGTIRKMTGGLQPASARPQSDFNQSNLFDRSI
jgi:hypothetical protein